jgi:hypothetical protein
MGVLRVPGRQQNIPDGEELENLDIKEGRYSLKSKPPVAIGGVYNSGCHLRLGAEGTESGVVYQRRV